MKILLLWLRIQLRLRQSIRRKHVKTFNLKCKKASDDTLLLANAQQRVQKLLEDYVTNIGESVGKTYKIE